MFALLIVSYIYLKGRSPEWPPGYFAPVLFWGTLNTAILLASTLPNQMAKKAADRMDLRALRLWLGIAIGFGLVFGIASSSGAPSTCGGTATRMDRSFGCSSGSIPRTS